ncbi:MAG: TerC family protein [Polyangiaceae bacterium]
MFASVPPLAWCGFIAFVLAMLALDLGVFHRKAHAVTMREAGTWSAVWVALALAFAGLVHHKLGSRAAVEFVTGYLIEKSLSIDNVFVFVLVFASLGIPSIYQHRVLFWGVLSALVLRAAMIVGGAALIERFHWMLYVFGGFLVLTGIKLFMQRNEKPSLEDGVVMRLARRVLPTTQGLRGQSFLVRENGRLLATPLLLALLLVEFTDVIFAVDSIPAIFTVTTDPFIVFTSNVFAILGLRSLFFLLAGMVDRFAYLKVGLSVVLAFVGAKMLIAPVLKIPPVASLAVIIVVLAASVLASLRKPVDQPAVVSEAESD